LPDGSSWYGQFELARALMGLNRVETAQKIAEEARKRNPDYPLLHLLLANIHIRKRDYPALLGDLATFLKLEPNGPTSDQVRQTREKVQRALANVQNVLRCGSAQELIPLLVDAWRVDCADGSRRHTVFHRWGQWLGSAARG